MIFKIPDLDLDCSQNAKTFIEDTLMRIPASKITTTIVPHIVGSYFCDIPKDEITGLASIDYKRAEEEFGYVKVDILHNTIYDEFETRSQLEECLKQDIDWDMLDDRDIVEQLPHINNYFDLLQELPPISSIEELAFFLAIIRPAKKKYIPMLKQTQDWNTLKDIIWVKEGSEYQYKKSHSIVYAMSITVAMRTLANKT